MAKNSKQKPNLNSILISLPKLEYGLLDHIRNIRKGISKIREYSKDGIMNPVIGYYRIRSAMGDTQILHQVLSLKEAKEAKEKDPSFLYQTLEILLREKKAYKTKEYKIRDGHFVGLNSY